MQYNTTLPVNGDGDQSEDGGCDRDVGYEIVDSAVERTEGPVGVQHEDEVEDAVEKGHHQVRDAQVHQEVVSHRPHPPMSYNKMELGRQKK